MEKEGSGLKKVAIITARGGSKRIPGKNIKEFCGKPIISYAIEAAKYSNIFDTVMVSTDNQENADVAKKYGADVPFMRSSKNSDDFTTTADVLVEVISEYEKLGQHYDYVCCLYPTAPFVTSEKLKRGINLLIENGADSLIPIVKFSFPPQRGLVINNNHVKYKWPENKDARSQDLETLYHDCGQFYIIRVDAFKKTHSLIMEDTIPMIFSPTEVQDIDDFEDWRIAEMKYRMLYEK